jgi:hypothetical protein
MQWTSIEPWDAGPLAPPSAWDDKLADAVLSSTFEKDEKGDIKFDADGKAVLKATANVDALSVAIGVAKAEASAADPSGNAADAVAKLLVQTLDAVEPGSADSVALEKAVRKAITDDPEVLDSLATMQLGVAKAGGATLTPYQEGVFLFRFKEFMANPYDTIDQTRDKALLAAQTAPANPPGTNPDGQVNRGNFDIANALFTLSPNGYRTAPPSIDSQGRSVQSFIMNGGVDDNPYTMEITQYRLVDGVFDGGSAGTVLDDGSSASITFRGAGVSRPYQVDVVLPDGQSYSCYNWQYDVTDPVSAYRRYSQPSDPLGIARLKALVEGTTPPAMPVAPPATPAPVTPPSTDLPAPVLPPGVEPGTDENPGGPIYAAANPSDAGRIASALLRNQPEGSYALVMKDVGAGTYWVTGPYAGAVPTASVEARFPAGYERAGMVGGPEPAPATVTSDVSPGLGVDNEKSSNIRRYPVTSYYRGLDFATELVRGAGYGDYADVVQHKITGEHVVFGPFDADDPNNEDFILRAIQPEYKILQRVYNVREELPSPLPAFPIRRPGRFDAQLYAAYNSVDAGFIGLLLMRRVMDGTFNNYTVILRDRLLGRYYVDGPFDMTEISTRTAQTNYPLFLEVMYIQTTPALPYIPRQLPPGFEPRE